MSNTTSKSLNQLRDEALRIAHEHGFKSASVLEDLCLIHSEVSEACEDFRAGRGVNHVFYESKPFGGGAPIESDIFQQNAETLNKPCGIPSEMADIVIRVLHFCGKHGIDIDQAVKEKMLYNDSRPYKHGKVL